MIDYVKVMIFPEGRIHAQSNEWPNLEIEYERPQRGERLVLMCFCDFCIALNGGWIKLEDARSLVGIELLRPVHWFMLIPIKDLPNQAPV